MAVAPEAMHEALASAVGAHGLPGTFTDSHPNLFAALPVYVSREHLTELDRVAAAVQEVVALPDYLAAVLAWAPEIAQYDPGTPGGMLGLDFHITPEGPRLIEINTNPGGALLNALVGQALHSCMPDIVTAPTDMAEAEQHVLQVMRQEWTRQAGNRPLVSIAIVDEAPAAQYLYPEFLLFRELFIRHGIDATICDPAELEHRHGHLWVHGKVVDMIYNRLTDFPLTAPAHETIRKSYLAGEVVVTPHPRAHALYADKRNLALLGNREFLIHAGATTDVIDTLASAVPTTTLMTAENRDELWSRRRGLFFKPAAGFGSKASYRGDKLTRRVWEDMGGSAYIAQELVRPSERHTRGDNGPMKSDIRVYAYQGLPLLYAARLYQGQTTNFRTPGGGFAPVLTSAG
ncbi:hypothetical protein [Dyella subtropica]|uniref:hypothetical protein n=1 Tax=Dyella subtropica TaxID=2992127 RepID=UPI00224F92B0|nr:hypothetical protein [Dyella subtropica]